MGETKKAARYYRKAIDSAPASHNADEARYELAMLLVASGDLIDAEETIADFSRTSHDIRKSYNLLMALAEALVRIGRGAAAITVLERISSLTGLPQELQGATQFLISDLRTNDRLTHSFYKSLGLTEENLIAQLGSPDEVVAGIKKGERVYIYQDDSFSADGRFYRLRSNPAWTFESKQFTFINGRCSRVCQTFTGAKPQDYPAMSHYLPASFSSIDPEIIEQSHWPDPDLAWFWDKDSGPCPNIEKRRLRWNFRTEYWFAEVIRSPAKTKRFVPKKNAYDYNYSLGEWCVKSFGVVRQ